MTGPEGEDWVYSVLEGGWPGGEGSRNVDRACDTSNQQRFESPHPLFPPIRLPGKPIPRAVFRTGADIKQNQEYLFVWDITVGTKGSGKAGGYLRKIIYKFAFYKG